ncbi:alpha-2,8-polysialyltransferase family protein [Schleiferiaceae bacterium]|nr:alpha-2,8-polysialyltransferase family protein [Schleiferiaceae bacterium]
MNVLIVDNQYTLIDKNFNGFINQSENLFFYIAIIDVPNQIDSVKEKNAKNRLSQHPHVVDLGVVAFLIDDIKKLVSYYGIKMAFFECYRIVDQYWISILNMLNVTTVHVQHGFEINHVYYKTFTLITKFNKGWKILKVLGLLSRSLDKNRLKMTIDYIRYIYLGTSPSTLSFSDPRTHPKYNLVYSDFYRSFWKSKFGIESPTRFFQYPDISAQKIPDHNSCDVVYIAQTLVEDGRLKKSDFVNYLSMMRQWLIVNSFNLIIKLHPRSDLTLYSQFRDSELSYSTVRGSIVVNHYSSLLFLYGMDSDSKIILFELPGNPTPPIFEGTYDQKVRDFREISLEFQPSKGERVKFCKSMCGVDQPVLYDVLNYVVKEYELE